MFFKLCFMLFQRPQVFELAEESQALKENLLYELDILEAMLKKQDGGWLVGDKMTIADLSVIASLSMLESVNFDFIKYENISKWRQQMKDTSIYKEANKQYEEWKKFIRTPQWRNMMKARLKH